MCRKDSKIGKWFVLFLLWLVFSPLFYYYAKRWNMIKNVPRVILLIFSPLVMLPIISAILFLLLMYSIGAYQRAMDNRDTSSLFADNKRVERITGVPFPEYDIVEYKRGDSNFLGDYKDEIVVEMKSELSDADFCRLDSIIANDSKTNWRKNNDSSYTFGIMWGTSFPAPPGENPEEDRFFNIEIRKGSKRAQIHYGAW